MWVLVCLAMACVVLLVAILAGYGIKIHTLLSDPAAFEACGVAYLRDIFFFNIIVFSVFGGCGVFAAVVGALDELKVYGVASASEALARVFAIVVLTYGFLIFVATMVAWFGTDNPQEIFLFYPEFYDDDFSNCSSGQDLTNVELAVGVFKVESSLLIASTLICSSLVCCALSIERAYA